MDQVTLRKAAEMALELLENHVEDPRCEVSICKTIATLRQALAQPDNDLEEAIKRGTKAWAGVDPTKWVDELRGDEEQDHIRDATEKVDPEWIEDGFGTMWQKCGKKDCGKFVVKIGKVDCWNGDCLEKT